MNTSTRGWTPGTSRGASGLHPQLHLVAGGTGEVSIHTAFQGAVFAPNGKINLATANSPGHAGQFIADRIEVHQNQTITYAPFEGWDGVWDSPAPTESGGDSGDSGVVRLFGDTPAGNALKQLHLATATQTDPGVIASRLAAVKALPVADVVTELTNAANNAEDSTELWITLFLSATVEDAAIVPLLTSVLTESVPEHYLSEHFDSHDATFDARLSILRRSTASLARLVGAGITEAREPLPSIVDEMVDRLLPGDEEVADIRDAQPSDFDLTPPNGVGDDSPANGAKPGNSEGNTVSMPTCSDGLKNQTETAVDCGGGCDPCGNGQQCQQHSDCVSLNCNAGVCQAGSGTTSTTTTGGTTTSTTSGTGGTGGGGSCSEATAIDLGAPGNSVNSYLTPNARVFGMTSKYWGGHGWDEACNTDNPTGRFFTSLVALSETAPDPAWPDINDTGGNLLRWGAGWAARVLDDGQRP